MAEPTRRQFAAGCLAVSAAYYAPAAIAAPSFTLSALPEPLRIGIARFTEAYEHYCRSDANYFDSKFRAYGPSMWRMAYEEAVDAHACLSWSVNDDTAAQRDVLAWADRLVPPVCERVQAFWIPLEGLTPTFAGYQKAAYAARRDCARAKWELWAAMKRQDEHACNEGHDAVVRVFGGWSQIRSNALHAWAKTPSDREFQRRMVQTFLASDALDLPYLRRVGLDVSDYLDWDDVLHCPLPCMTCRSVFGDVPFTGAV